MSTVFALASGAGRCGVSIIRVSGPSCKNIYEQLTGKTIANLQPRLLHNVKLRHKNEHLDNAMAVYFKNPASFTGEDIIEFHVHGSPLIVNSVFDALNALSARMARPGEFAERAFHSGKMSLLEAEGLGDLLAAETACQKKQALWLLGGGGREKINLWRGGLIECLAGLEAYLDFSEDADVNWSIQGTDNKLLAIHEDINRQLSMRSGERLREGFKVVLCGRPNSGKSSLFNLLIGRSAAIVSPIPGTTRDILQASIDLDGLPVTLYDTAGLRENSSDEIELEGMRRARTAIHEADLVVNLIDPAFDNNDSDDEMTNNQLNIYNKNDLYSVQMDNAISISCKSREGVDTLIKLMSSRLLKDRKDESQESTTEMAIITRERHRHLLQSCSDNLMRAITDTDCIVKAEFARRAVGDIGRITGEASALIEEELLNSLFRSFCIGK